MNDYKIKERCEQVLIEYITKIERAKGLISLMLFTEDARKLYTHYRFKKVSHPGKLIKVNLINMYRKSI
jgi:hypothetical protein